MASTNYTYSPTSGSNGNTVTASTRTQNTGTANRVAVITLTGGTSTTQVTLKQLYRPFFTMSGGSTFPASGGTLYFTVSTEYDICFQNIPTWITIKRGQTTYTSGQKISKGVANGSIFALVAAENTGNTRADNYMGMGHYFGDTLQTYYQFFSTTQEAAYSYRPLTFNVTSSGSINFLHKRAPSNDVGNLTIQYRKNGGTWTSITSSTGGTSFNVSSGDIVEFRGNNATYSTELLSYTTFSGSTATFSVCGNIMSLVSSTTFQDIIVIPSNYMFNYLFASTNVTNAESLVMRPTALKDYCYASMFENCANLTKAPELPAPVLASASYARMFRSCSSLNHIRCYATDISSLNCTSNWVYNVASSGTFVKSTNMTDWTIGDSGIPTNWVTQNYTPTKDMQISPTTASAASGDTAFTLTVATTGCVFSGFTYNSSNFTVNATKSNNTIKLTFSANNGAQRTTTLTFFLKDTDGNEYARIVRLTQAAGGTSPSTRWTISNTCSFDISCTITTADGDITVNCGAGLMLLRQGDNLPLNISRIACTPDPLQQTSIVINAENVDTGSDFDLIYFSSQQKWVGTGTLVINAGQTLEFTSNALDT